jgi:hypothetical protein
MILDIFQNNIVISCFLAWVITQTLKTLIMSYKQKKFKIEYLLATGHMPSSHSGIVSSLVTAVYLEQGLTTLFTVSFIFALVVIRDSFGARFLIGENAKVINKLAKTNLKEVTGHRFKEVVVGSIIGIVIAISYFYF